MGNQKRTIHLFNVEKATNKLNSLIIKLKIRFQKVHQIESSSSVEWITRKEVSWDGG